MNGAFITLTPTPTLAARTPLAVCGQEKDAAPDNFECDACLRYSERVVLASHLKDARRCAEDGSGSAAGPHTGRPRGLRPPPDAPSSPARPPHRPAEALPYAIEGLALLEPWGQQFELALPDRTPHYPAQVRGPRPSDPARLDARLTSRRASPHDPHDPRSSGTTSARTCCSAWSSTAPWPAR